MEHEIILDLLPLYHDGVCSAASRTAVEAHLETCEVCRKALTDMDAPLPEAERKAADDAAAVRKISQEWKKGWRKAWKKGAVIAAAVCILAYGTWYGLTQWCCIPVDLTVAEVSEVARMQDGRIVFQLEFPEGSVRPTILWEEDGNGGVHMTAKRCLIQKSWKHSDGYFSYGIAGEKGWSLCNGDGTQITKIYVGEGENAILVWEEGMELPAASAAQEAKYHPKQDRFMNYEWFGRDFDDAD